MKSESDFYAQKVTQYTHRIIFSLSYLAHFFVTFLKLLVHLATLPTSGYNFFSFLFFLLRLLPLQKSVVGCLLVA